MTCSVFIPSLESPMSSEHHSKYPYVMYLSGLTCTDENVCQKGAPFAHLMRHKMGFVAPDTSPRGHNPIQGESDSWDFGLGAGFYLNATNDL